ncbi:MAG: DUF1553 domain-containing protein [Phycisphaeraceae bacterium]
MRILWTFACLIAVAPAASPLCAAEEPLDFNRDIRPILSANCFQCHGPDEKTRKADRRLDTREGALADHDGFRAIVPGKLDESELVARIMSKDRTEVMPPAKLGKTLKPREIETLKKWVAQGAPYAKHWAYVAPVKGALPDVSKTNAVWTKNPIDRLILARLLSEGLLPSPQADRYTLARRASLDITGLPPTVAEVDAFVKDTGPDAYGKYVDRMLAKESYGEHWARKWLDLARYADSSGYADDPARVIWGYRDWVIRAFNANMPFDQFTVLQLAGDLLNQETGDRSQETVKPGQSPPTHVGGSHWIPQDETNRLIATAFHRNTQTNNEGGTNDEEYRNVAVVDRVNTTFATWMGTTMACAQCHTHKFDPISQKEYFQVFAILNNSADADRRDESPTIASFSDEQEEQKAKLRDEIAKLTGEVEKAKGSQAAAQAAWEKTLAGNAKPGVVGRFVKVEIIDRAEFLSLAEVQVFSGGENVALKGKATQSSTDYDGPPHLAIDGNTNGDYNVAKSTSHTKSEKNPWWQVDLGKAFAIDRIAVWNRTDGNVGGRLAGYRISILDEKQQVLSQEQFAEAPAPSREVVLGVAPADIIAIANTALDKRSAAQVTRIGDYFDTINPQSKPLRDRLAKAQKQLNDMKPANTVPILRELPANQRRVTKIQIRGNYLDTGDVVQPGLPESLGLTPPEGATLDRLAMARWLVDARNPLTARVTVNRYWEKVFGTGIVATSEEFGSQGDQPVNQALLDWLAVDLVESKWNMKRLLRMIVTSEAYKQESKVSPELLERDPDNRLVARGPRFRLSAEAIRDQALFVSGLLSPKMFGPPVRPPQPSFGVSAAFGGGIDWTTSTGEDKFRRGLYTTWRRSNPYPSMAAFDAPNREVCTVRRDRTNTPLQALVTLNDPVYVEAAQALARRMMTEGGSSPQDRVRYGLRLCVSRHATEKEVTRLVKLFESSRAHFTQDKKAAMEMATKPIGPLPGGTDVVDAAAWTVVGNVMLNLDEMFMSR